jgi:hypothetical protein
MVLGKHSADPADYLPWMLLIGVEFTEWSCPNEKMDLGDASRK